MFNGFVGLGRMLVFAGLVQMAVPALAAKLQISGNIKAAPCEVDAANSNIQVNLGDNISAATLATSGSGSEWIDFPVTLKNCPATTRTAKATFSGVVADESVVLYKSSGSSRRVQIELQSQNGTNLGNDKNVVQLVDQQSHEAIFNLRARAYSTHGGATPGTIEGVMQITFVYE